MAALENTRFVRFALPPSNPPFCNKNTLWPDQTSRSICSLNTSGGQKTRRFADTPCSAYQAEADRNRATRAQDCKRALADNDDESDDEFPSLEELSRAALRSKISTEASKTRFTLQLLEQPALHGAGLQVNSTQSGWGECQGNSRDQPVILDDDDADNIGAGNEAEGAFGDIDTGRIGRDASPHIFATSELAPTPTEFIGASGPWYDVEEACYVDEPAPEPRPREQIGAPSTLAQAQPQTLSQSSTPLQDQTNQQNIDDITQSTSMESAPHSRPKPSDNGNDGWTDDSMAELEKALGLALEEQHVESSSAGTPTPLSPRSVEAPPDETQSRERTETTGSRPEELQDTSRYGTAQGLEEWELQETEVVERGGVAMQQEELAAQKEELGQPAVGDQQALVEVVSADDPKDKEATEALPATQPEIPAINEHRFRLRGVRARQLAGRQTKTTQYRVVWGEHPNRSDSWFNEDDVPMSMLWPPCERSSQDLALQAENDIFRVCEMRSSRRKGRKVFEYLVDAFGLVARTWITEDQLRISLNPTLVAELKGN
ncbi:hypothetical protein BKA61DRAFT_183702 [Leptodontidium sp. MPI-SDFR-AT-0119]|nr:hypothetical protein BKA61DRAFT_183702 [Leptodontidium sp. MPI-SDFR-AT-0119]